MSGRTRSLVAIVLTLALALTALAATGCTKKQETSSAGNTSSGPQKGGTLSFYIGSPAYIDPYNTQESEGTHVESALFDSLTAFDPLDASKLVPAAAERWESKDGGKTWTFYLRKDGKFSDGTPVTAKDFIYAWNRMADPKAVNTITGKADPSVISYHLAPIQGFDDVAAGKAKEMSGLKAVDDYTLEVTLTKPMGDFEYVVGHPALAPVPQKAVEEGVDYNGKKVAYGDMPVGNGPFKMSEPWKHDQYIKVVRNDNYYGDKPYLDGIDFRIFKDPNTAYLEFEAGNLDFTQIGEGKIKDAQSKYGVADNGYTGNPGKQVLLGAENSTYYLILNQKDSALANADFRKAVSLAINRQAICDTVFEGTREPADNIVPPGIAGYEKGVWADSKYDVEAAKKALEAAGYPGGKGAPELKLSFNADGGHQKIMELIQSDLAAVGIKATLDSYPDFPSYLKSWDAGKLQIGRLGWSADYPIMDNFLYPIFYSTSGDNKSQYKNADVDKALDGARTVTDGAQRISAYQAVDQTIGADLPVVPVMFYKHHHVVASRVHDLTYSAQNLVDYTKVWLDQSAK